MSFEHLYTAGRAETDWRLVGAAVAGDQNAVSTLYSDYFTYLSHQAVRAGASLPDIDDIVHELFSALIEKRFMPLTAPHLDRGRSLALYLRKAIRNKVRDWERRKELCARGGDEGAMGVDELLQLPDEAPNAEEQASARATDAAWRRCINAALDRLGGDGRGLLIEKHLARTPVREMARLSGEAEHTLYKRLQRMEKRLRQIISNEAECASLPLKRAVQPMGDC